MICTLVLATPPSQRVQNMLGQDKASSNVRSIEPHPIFSEMEELFVGADGKAEWKETARFDITLLNEYGKTSFTPSDG